MTADQGETEPVETLLHDYEHFEQAVRNFAWLQDAHAASDVDFLKERRGRFLIIEGKRWNATTGGVRVPLGQHIALRALSRLPRFTVYLVGECEDRTFRVLRYDVWSPLAAGSSVRFPSQVFRSMDAEGLRALVTEWEASCE